LKEREDIQVNERMNGWAQELVIVRMKEGVNSRMKERVNSRMKERVNSRMQQ
jgi:hypothetical protein